MKIVLGLLVAIAGAALSTEYLSELAVADFNVGYEAADARQSIRELVPAGETVEDWTRMITDQRFVGLSRRMSEGALAQAMADGLATSCPGGKAGPIWGEIVGSRPSARMRADCPLNPATGKPESFIVLVISGKDDLHSRQVAWRKAPSPEDIAWGEAVLDRTRLCLVGTTCMELKLPSRHKIDQSNQHVEPGEH